MKIKILTDVKSARSNYEELKQDKIADANIDSIIADMESAEFEKFYAYFSMKDKFNKSMLEKLNLTTKRLAKTDWFKQKIAEIIQK